MNVPPDDKALYKLGGLYLISRYGGLDRFIEQIKMSDKPLSKKYSIIKWVTTVSNPHLNDECAHDECRYYNDDFNTCLLIDKPCPYVDVVPKKQGKLFKAKYKKVRKGK